jgi:hypothetical protein
MWNRGLKSLAASKGLLLLGLATASSVWLLLSWASLGSARAAASRDQEKLVRIFELAERLVAHRAQVGERVPVIAPSTREDLIPFLESGAVRVGIPKEALSINTQNPKPVPGRPGLVEQETRIGVEPVSAARLVQFLVSLERDFPAIEIREILLSPYGRTDREQLWPASAAVSITTRGVEPR